MKKILLLILISASAIVGMKAQSAIYVCGNTGAFGYSWAGSTAGKDRLELEMIALEGCRNNGGTACEFLQYFDCHNCYVALVLGSDGTSLYTTMYARYESAATAESKAQQAYRDAGNANL